MNASHSATVAPASAQAAERLTYQGSPCAGVAAPAPSDFSNSNRGGAADAVNDESSWSSRGAAGAAPLIHRSLWDRLARRIVFASGCWTWRGARNPSGYGRFGNRPNGRSQLAHRLVYECLVGEIPGGLVIDHLCRTPECVNPYHMEPVTNGENVRRGLARPRTKQAHCFRGHPFAGANLMFTKSQRICRACESIRRAKHAATIKNESGRPRANEDGPRRKP